VPFSFDEATASALRLGSVFKIKLRSTDQKALTLKGGLAPSLDRLKALAGA